MIKFLYHLINKFDYHNESKQQIIFISARFSIPLLHAVEDKEEHQLGLSDSYLGTCTSVPGIMRPELVSYL